MSTTRQYDLATGFVTGTAAETFTYDAAGRLTQDARGTYTYSPVGHLVRAQAPNIDATYQYDADEQRLYRIVNGVTHWTLRSLGGEVLSEYQTRCGTRAGCATSCTPAAGRSAPCAPPARRPPCRLSGPPAQSPKRPARRPSVSA
ncbi:MAG: hypothetical protein ACRD2X_18760 [Vicinamibacteraceae bacterium]